MIPRNDHRVVLDRPDGRPEVYDVGPAVHAHCGLCLLEKKDVRYKRGEIFMTSPIDAADGQAHLICMGHIPDNAVIFNPDDGTCRNKAGETWREDD